METSCLGGGITICLSFFVVKNLIIGGWIKGTRAIYEYAATAVAPTISIIPISFILEAINIVVGPSAPPIIPIADASSIPKLKLGKNPINRAPINATNTPAWAAAPSNKVFGLEITGEKSVNAPKPKNTRRGSKSVWSPFSWKNNKNPIGSPSPDEGFTSSPRGKFARRTPKEIGTRSSGSFFLAIPKYIRKPAINHIIAFLGLL